MRFAGDNIQKYTGDSDVSDHGRAWQNSHRLMQQDKRIVPGFNTEDLQETPELPAGNLYDQNNKGRYILNNPASGVSSVEGKQVALAPAIPIATGLAGKAMKAYGAFKLAEKTLDGGRVNSGTRSDYAGQDPTAQPGTTSSHKRGIGGAVGDTLMKHTGKLGLGGMVGGFQ